MNTTSTRFSTISLLNPPDTTNYTLVTVINDTAMRIEMTEFIRTVNHWLLIAECLMVVFGILGNGLALIVINRRSLRDTSSSVFITYLAIFDSSVLIVHITGLLVARFIRSYIFHCFLIFLTDFVTFTSVWIMVIMTLERCIAVHSPFLAKRFCTRQRARYSMYLLISFAFLLFTISFPFIYTINLDQEKCGVRLQYQTILRLSKATIFYFIPDFILLINLFIIYEIVMARRRRTRKLINPENAIHQLDAISFNRKQQQLTIMLVSVSLSFYLFTTPAIIDYIRQRNPPMYRDVKRLKMRFLRTNLTVLWLQMSSATNFIFYCLAGSKFRLTCLETFDDICVYLCSAVNANYSQQRSSSAARTSSNLALEMRNGVPHHYRSHRRSTSNLQTCTYRLSQSSKRASNETVFGSQLNSRRQSKSAAVVHEV